MERMRSVTHQLTGMIEEILTYSSLEAGRELVRPRPTTAAEPVHAAAAVVEPLALPKGLTFSADVAPDVPPLFTDPDKVRQILVNLAGNAVKFTERGGVRVEVTRLGDDAVRFAVSDTGPGIAAEDLGRLFQAFTQLHTGLTRRYGGTGLGLYISRRLAELLGGRIEVRSVVGEGSVFSLVIPVRAG
jgi:signal transduction histidine kinase